MKPTDITVEIAQNIGTIALNRPDKINSFTRSMHDQLREALTAMSADANVRTIVIKGNGRGFCAGQDLADLSMDPKNLTDLGDLVGDYFNPLILQIRHLPKPVIAQVHGIAAGAGANLALACDLVIAAEDAAFLQAFVNIGLVPDSGGTWFLPQLLGPQRAMGLALLGEKMSARQAADWGLIWQAVPADQLQICIDKTSKRLADLPAMALAAIKKTIHHAATSSLPEQLALEKTLQSTLGASADYQEGVAAFLAKRPAVFKGA